MAGMPVQRVPHDAMRLGLASLREDASVKHPVEAIQSEYAGRTVAAQQQMLRDLYGSAAPARSAIEAQILGRVGRLPGLPSSRLGLEALTGELDEFRFESYLGLPEAREDVPIDIHSAMERQLRLGPGTKPNGRGFL